MGKGGGSGPLPRSHCLPSGHFIGRKSEPGTHVNSKDQDPWSLEVCFLLHLWTAKARDLQLAAPVSCCKLPRDHRDVWTPSLALPTCLVLLNTAAAPG